MNTLTKTILALCAAGLFLSDAQAAPIQGDIDFGGVVTFDTLSLATATRVTNWNSSFVLKDSGDFAAFVSAGANATMATPWIFNPSTSTPNLWSVGGFTFNLASSVIVSQSSTFLNITGIGTITGNGFDPTAGTWSFTSSRSNGSNSASFGFQTDSAAVPEGGTVGLLVFGGLLLTGTWFRRKRQTA